MNLTNKTILLVTALIMVLPSVAMAKGTKKTEVSSVVQSAPKPAPKPVAPRPSLYSGPDYSNVLGLGNYFVGQ